MTGPLEFEARPSREGNGAFPRVLACASQGSGGDDEARLLALLANLESDVLPFDRSHKARSFRRCMTALRRGGFDLFVLEGTGFAAGFAAILGALLYGRHYVLSSGDAVGPFLSARFPAGSPVFHAYERLLYRCCSGFIGWTPYLVGRALTLGAPCAVTCPGWAPHVHDPALLMQARQRIRSSLSIPDDAVVFGIAGSLTWSGRYRYCYGAEMVRALRRSASTARVLIVGDGSGLDHLRREAGDLLGSRVFLPGRVPREQVPEYLAAMDVGSLPQSVDRVGSFRYSTKISEYRSLGLPFFTNRVPVGYDLDEGDLWRLPGASPWSSDFLNALAHLMTTVKIGDMADSRCMRAGREFDREAQVRRVTAFLNDLALREDNQPA